MARYRWRGAFWEISDEDISKYPGAVLAEDEAPKEKKKPEAKNKSRRPAKTK